MKKPKTVKKSPKGSNVRKLIADDGGPRVGSGDAGHVNVLRRFEVVRDDHWKADVLSCGARGCPRPRRLQLSACGRNPSYRAVGRPTL